MTKPPKPTFEVLESKCRDKPITLRNHGRRDVTIPPDFPVYYVASRQLGLCGALFLTRREAQDLVDTLHRVWRPSTTKAWHEWFAMQYRSGRQVKGFAQDSFGPLERD